MNELYKIVIRTENIVLKSGLDYESASEFFAKCDKPNKMIVPNKYEFHYESTMGHIWA